MSAISHAMIHIIVEHEQVHDTCAGKNY